MSVWWSVLLCCGIFSAGFLIGGVIVYARTSLRYMRLLREQHSAYLRVLASDRRRPEPPPTGKHPPHQEVTCGTF